MRITLDPAPLTDPGVFEPEERGALIAGVVTSTIETLHQLSGLLAAADLPAAVEAAHRGRNEALAVGAAEMARAFGALEQAARSGAPAPAQDALRELDELWPPTREAIARLTEGVDTSGPESG
jgi:HPt (histidine-containing phosphotransfer) domain-containing protein